MDLDLRKSEEPGNLSLREIPRNCGNLMGGLDDLLPFLYIAQLGASMHDMLKCKAEKALGLFSLSDTPGILPHLGLILPLRLCRDEKARAALQEIPNLIGTRPRKAMSDKRRAVQAKLDKAFGSDLMLTDQENVDDFVGLRPGPGLFMRFHESFDYVTDVIDKPAGLVSITGTAHFRWKTYGELMEWFHTRGGSDPYGMWSMLDALTPYFISGKTALTRWSSDGHQAPTGLKKPIEGPSKCFIIRPGLPNARIGIRLVTAKYCWGTMHISLDDVTAAIELSGVYESLGDIIAWGREIEEGDLPTEVEIDDDGEVAVLAAFRTEDPERVLLRAIHKHPDRILLEGIVSRAELASALKNELRRYFISDVDSQYWETDPIQLKDLVLNNAWLSEQE